MTRTKLNWLSNWLAREPRRDRGRLFQDGAVVHLQHNKGEIIVLWIGARSSSEVLPLCLPRSRRHSQEVFPAVSELFLAQVEGFGNAIGKCDQHVDPCVAIEPGEAVHSVNQPGAKEILPSAERIRTDA